MTGALPWFRYVLLTDALIENLNPLEVAAVFGHEIGHIAHRHLFYLGFFFVGSLGVMALLLKVIDAYLMPIPPLLLPLARGDSDTRVDPPVGVGLAQSSRSTSCWSSVTSRGGSSGRPTCLAAGRSRADTSDCPPHADPDSPFGGTPAMVPLCPVGIRIFANALANVAALNGMEHGMRSWRHGSIKWRIGFLEGLEGRPEAERRFQAGVGRLRLGVALALIAVLVYAMANGAIDQLR